MRIGDLSARSGLSRDTIRYYERLGLLPAPPRSPGGYRVYGDRALTRLRVVRNARAFGFSLTEISDFLRTRDTGGAPCRQVRLAAERRLADVEARIHDMVALRDTMRATLAHWDERLARTPAGTPARLLEDGDWAQP